jgi:uncharacterized protein YjiS (DUF1127 family)
MREYALSQARSIEATHSFSRLRLLMSNWLKRRQLRRVENLDDHILQDIGVTRSELATALRLPLGIDPVWELERTRRRLNGRRVN